MDANSATLDLGALALKLAVGVAVGLLGAILVNFEYRLQKVEDAKLTQDDIKNAVKAVLHDDEITSRKHR